MRSFNKKGLGIIIRSVLFIAVIICLNEIMRFIVMPPSYTRYILGELNDKNQNYDCVVLGASHGRSAINPYKLDEVLDCNSINLSIPNETVKDSYYLLKECYRKNQPETIIFDIDYQYWYKLVQSEYWTTFIYEQLDFSPIKLEYLSRELLKKDFRVGLSRWAYYLVNGKINLLENTKLKLSKAYRNNELSVVKDADAGGKYVGKGFYHRVRGNNKGKFKKVSIDTNDLEQDAVNYFKRIVDFCKKKGARLVCITSPIMPASLNYGCYEEVHQYFTELCKQHQVEYYDFNYIKNSVFSFKNMDFVDYDGHMTGNCANRFSVVLANVVKKASGDAQFLKKNFYQDFKEYSSSFDEIVTNDINYILDVKQETGLYQLKFKNIVVGGCHTEAETKTIVKSCTENKNIYEEAQFSDYDAKKEYSFDVKEGVYEVVIYARRKGTAVEYEELCRRSIKVDANEVYVCKTKLAVGDYEWE